MISAIFAMFIGVITFFVTAIIIIGILLLPLLFKGGWVLYIIFVLLLISSHITERDKKNNENK